MNFYESLKTELDQLQDQGQFRELRNISYRSGKAFLEGKELLNLSSNDYLGLAARADLREEFFAPLCNPQNAETFSMTASSSRLLTGNHPGYAALESQLSRLYNGRAALVVNSGYHANIGILPALTGSGDLILSDKLNHASIIDGIRLSEAAFKRYGHLDYDQLEKILAEKASSYKRIFIISESVFSMDGDIADLKRLVGIKQRYNAVLLVDEAHAAGVFGAKGCGICEETGLIDEIDIIIGTFGKALCSAGAYAIMRPVVRDYLINKMRPLIFTTALPPVTVNWTSFILSQAVTMNARRRQLQELSAKFRAAIKEKGYKTGGSSQIVPLIIGDNMKTIELAEKLRNNGFLVFPVRPPTVPQGTSRLRFSLSANMNWDELKGVLDLL